MNKKHRAQKNNPNGRQDAKSKISSSIASPSHGAQNQNEGTKCSKAPCRWFQNIRWYFGDPNRALATFTCVLVIIGAGALWIARDTEKRQLRAYIFADPDARAESEGTIVQDVVAGQIPRANIPVRNVGQTPGYDVVIKALIIVLPY